MLLAACQESKEGTATGPATQAQSENAVPPTAAQRAQRPTEGAPPTPAAPSATVSLAELESPADLGRQIQAATSDEQLGSDDLGILTEKIDAYYAAHGFINGANLVEGRRALVASGTATAVVERGTPNFSEARILAFEQAQQRAIGDLVKANALQINASVLTRLSENSTDAAVLLEACKANAPPAIVQKAALAADGLINQALERLDQPVDGSATLAQPYRCDNPVFTDAIETKTRSTAVRSLVGARIVQSFSVNSEVGVVLVMSEKFAETARSLLRGDVARSPAVSPAAEIRAKLGDLKDEALLAMYGTRIISLSNGERAVVTFGQAAATIGPSDLGNFRSMKRRAAMEAASARAEGELARFAQATTYFDSLLSASASAAQKVVIEGDSIQQMDSQSIARKLETRIKTTSRLRVEGALAVGRWSLVDSDSGATVEGVILAWSPSMKGLVQGNTTAIENGKTGRVAAAVAGTTIRQGKELEEDF